MGLINKAKLNKTILFKIMKSMVRKKYDFKNNCIKLSLVE